MGKLQIKTIEPKHQQYDRRVKEQFINGLDNEDIATKIIKELTGLRDTNEVTSEPVLSWTQRVEVKRAQKSVLENIRDAKMLTQ